MYQGVKPLIAIVGRPNVGKSTLFNRLVGRPEAIVSWVAGTTRDRVIREAEWGGRSLIIIDTGGLDISPETEMSQKVTAQIQVAVEDADVIIALTDIANGVVAADRDVADVLRDPQYAALGSVVSVPDAELGAFRTHNVPFRLSDTPGAIRWGGPARGTHNDEVFGALGLERHEIADLTERGIV